MRKHILLTCLLSSLLACSDEPQPFENFFCDSQGCYACEGENCERLNLEIEPECGPEAPCSDGSICYLQLCLEFDPGDFVPECPNPDLGCCTDNEMCDEGSYCESSYGLCLETTACSEEGACPEGLVCDRDRNTCMLLVDASVE